MTPWHNDPVADPSGEAFYIRDERTGAFWSPTPLPARGRSGYDCRHGFGYRVFEHVENGIASELSIYVAMDAPVKLAVDVQGLKWINDNFGFSSGNALLRTLADTARDQGYDIYRVGGDEFVLTFNTQEEALVAISKLKEEFRAAYVPVRTETGDVIYYRGFVIYSGTGDTFDSAYRELDWDKKNLKAMYEAVNPELVRGGRPPGIKEAARLYNMANPEERRRALIDLFRFNEKQADAEMYAFAQLGAASLFAGHHPANATSRRVLIQLGFSYTHDEFYPPTGLMHPSYRLSAEECAVQQRGAPQMMITRVAKNVEVERPRRF